MEMKKTPTAPADFLSMNFMSVMPAKAPEIAMVSKSHWNMSGLMRYMTAAADNPMAAGAAAFAAASILFLCSSFMPLPPFAWDPVF